MLTIWDSGQGSFCDGTTRRNFLKAGALTLGGLSLADLLRLEARAQVGRSSPKSVIFVYLPGGPSHIDLYDPKPDAPVEIRGEFQTIRSNVPGLDLSEMLPLQASMADKLAVIRGFKTTGNHESQMLTTGFRPNMYRPAFGSIVSKLLPNDGAGLPAYVTLVQESNLPFGEDPAYLGPAYRPFSMRGQGMANLSLTLGVTLQRLADRRSLLGGFDSMRRDLDARGEIAGMDAFAVRALEMISSTRTRDAFDLNREPLSVREKYGSSPGTLQFLLARRLVEAGVRVLTLCGGWDNNGAAGSSSNLSNWDSHNDNFNRLRYQAPRLDHALYTLIDDLHQRGLQDDVVVVACGEMGRSPRVGRGNSDNGASPNGRDHWNTGFALISGGGLRMGQVIGATDRRGDQARGAPFTPANVLATLYRFLGIDPSLTFPDHNGRPQYILEERTPIAELL